MNRNVLSQIGLGVVLAAICVAARLMPHWPNFTPLAAAALFAGVVCRSRLTGVAIGLVAMLVSDVAIGFYDLRIMAVVYACLIVPAWLSKFVPGRFFALRALTCAAACSVLFFLATNLAVWCFAGSYEHSLRGLAHCFTAAWPFFRYTLGGDLVWSGVFFGAYAVAMAARGWLPQMERQRRSLVA